MSQERLSGKRAEGVDQLESTPSVVLSPASIPLAFSNLARAAAVWRRSAHQTASRRPSCPPPAPTGRPPAPLGCPTAPLGRPPPTRFQHFCCAVQYPLRASHSVCLAVRSMPRWLPTRPPRLLVNLAWPANLPSASPTQS
eukprot:358258-Chlamydomonas_euryale.AAC.7